MAQITVCNMHEYVPRPQAFNHDFGPTFKSKAAVNSLGRSGDEATPLQVLVTYTRTLLKMGCYYNTTTRHYWDMLVK